MRTYPLRAVACLLFLLLFSDKPAAAQDEPIETRARNAWHQLGEDIEAGAAYAQAVAYSSGRMACPLPGSTFVDSWGAPRSGGRSHLGVDMMAPHGQPVLAPATGTYRQHGYESFYLEAVDGTLYFGTHVAGHLHPDGPVQAGTPIAVNSNTGNASGGAPHLHLQIAPDGGENWVNPYPAALAACTAQPAVQPVAARAPVTERPPTGGEVRFCRWVNRGVNARMVRCLHEAQGHDQWNRGAGTPGHTWVRFVREARQLRAWLAALVPPIPNEANWDRVAECESGGDWSINTGNGYYGGLQFSLGTWGAYGGSGYPHHQSKAAQIAVAERVRTQSGLHHWPVCGARW